MPGKNYVGKGGHLAVMGEFLLRGYNVAMPEVDVGDDIFVVHDRTKPAGDEGIIVLQALDGKDRRTLVTGGSDPRVLPTGHLVYIHDGVLLGVPFDRKRLVGPQPLLPILDRIVKNESIMHMARLRAAGLADAIRAMK